MSLDLATLTLTEIIQLQERLSQELKRRFERPLALVFTDVVDSTTYFARFGDEAGRRLQQRHFDLLADAVRAHKGRVVDTAGDGAFTVFEAAPSGAAALIALQQSVAATNATRDAPHALRLRAALHYGRVLTDGAQVSGDAVNLAARLVSAAEPNEVLVSRAAVNELPSALRLRCYEPKARALKGLAEPVEALRLVWLDEERFPTRVRIDETGQELPLPAREVVRFGRISTLDNEVANEVVLLHPDPAAATRVSRWHFELHRNPEGYLLRSVSDQPTEVDGVALRRGGEAAVGPGSVVRVAGVLTVRMLAGSPRRASSSPMLVATSTLTEQQLPAEAAALLDKLTGDG